MVSNELIFDSFMLIKNEIENLARRYEKLNSDSFDKIQNHIFIKEQNGFQIQNEIDMELEKQAQQFYAQIIKELRELLTNLQEII